MFVVRVVAIIFGGCALISLFPTYLLQGFFYSAVETYACPICDILIIVGIFKLLHTMEKTQSK